MSNGLQMGSIWYYLLGNFIFGMLAPKMATNLTNVVLNTVLLEKRV